MEEKNSTSLNTVLLALKKNIMKDTHVCDVAKVKLINEKGDYTCESILDGSSIRCTAINNLDISVSDIVCILYADYPFNNNLRQLKSGSNINLTNNDYPHSKQSGIIIGIIYKKETEES